MKNYAIIVSAGKGRRMESKEKKQYLRLAKIPVLSRTILAFEQCDFICDIILVIPKEDHEYCKQQILPFIKKGKKIHLIDGGKERYDSVLNGLQKVESITQDHANTMVLVHDGVRPFAEPSLINMCIKKAKEHGACIPGIVLSDTVKQIDKNGYITATLDRETIYSAQTPQVFQLDLLLQAFEHAQKTMFLGTDDASYMEHMGHPVFITPGSKRNIKITTKDDLIIAAHILDQQILDEQVLDQHILDEQGSGRKD